MLRKLPEPLVNEIALRAIRCTVRTAIRRGWFSPAEMDDLTHDIVVRLLQKMLQFDPTRSSWATFCTIVAVNFLKSESKRRKNRPCPDSLHDQEASDPAACYEDSVEDHHATGRCFTRQRTRYERIELHEDVTVVVRGLTDPLRNFCEAFLQEPTYEKVADMLGVDRKTVYRRRDIVRECLRESLHEYQYED